MVYLTAIYSFIVHRTSNGSIRSHFLTGIGSIRSPIFISVSLFGCSATQPHDHTVTYVSLYELSPVA
jgi:hypothetical protein